MHPIVPGMLPTVSSEPSRVTPPRALRRPQDWRDWVGLALRLLTGVVMIWAGATKIGNLPLNVEQVKLYQLGLGDTLSTLIGYAQPPLEFVVGALLVVGLFTRVASVLNGLAMIVFTFGIAWAWAHGLRLDCGCFGQGGILSSDQKPQYLWDIIRDIGLLAASVWLVIRPRTALSVDGWLFRPLSVDDDDHVPAHAEKTPHQGS